MSDRAKYGRRYSGDEEKAIADLVANHGLAGTQRRLHARNGVVGVSKVERSYAEQRRAAGFDKPVNISLPTLKRIADDHGITLKPGRPTLAEQEPEYRKVA